MVVVYAHRIKDSQRAEMVIAPHKRTLNAIKALKGEAILETGEEVPETSVIEGRYEPCCPKSA